MSFKSNKRKGKAGLLLLFFMSVNFCYGQFPYALSSKVDYCLIGLGAVSLTAGQIISSNNPILTVDQINNLDPNAVNSFDRNTIFNYSESSNTLSEALLIGTGLSSLTLLLDKSIRKEWATVGVMGVEVLMVTYGLASVTKGTSLRARPYAYNPAVSNVRKQNRDARYSFYSQSTAATAGISFFAARVFSDTHPNSKWKPLIWTGAAILPMVTGWAKIDAGEHFKTDVIIGYAMGALTGYFIPVLHLQKDTTKAKVSLEPSFNGLALRVVF
ncbi:MAG: membrane-associated phospholipid phosphatase [Salibacteraceae bacterium]|jgi:membrane-associated phospholipid phosphatase